MHHFAIIARVGAVFVSMSVALFTHFLCLKPQQMVLCATEIAEIIAFCQEYSN